MAALLLMADRLFPESHGSPKAVPKTGSAANLINELIAAAKAAIDALWKSRGYLELKPSERKARLGYALDREEALGWLVASALHKPHLSAPEARVIGKRAGGMPYFAKAAEFKRRGTTGCAEHLALLAAPAPLSFAPPKAKKQPTAPAPPPAAPAPPPPAPVPPTPTPVPPPPPAAPPSMAEYSDDINPPPGFVCRQPRRRRHRSM